MEADYPKVTTFGGAGLLDFTETILGKSIGKVRVNIRKVKLGADTDIHGIRLDAYAETDGDMEVDSEAEIYDIESDALCGEESRCRMRGRSKKNIPVYKGNFRE